ncbi:hypothetical protein B0J17DRAFT_633645 [Rhizoctonia solani]|nr:hypothetical protein B0J17DRAFT_633645 [Rhizoctonia solani]
MQPEHIPPQVYWVKPRVTSDYCPVSYGQCYGALSIEVRTEHAHKLNRMRVSFERLNKKGHVNGRKIGSCSAASTNGYTPYGLRTSEEAPRLATHSSTLRSSENRYRSIYKGPPVRIKQAEQFKARFPLKVFKLREDMAIPPLPSPQVVYTVVAFDPVVTTRGRKVTSNLNATRYKSYQSTKSLPQERRFQ